MCGFCYGCSVMSHHLLRCEALKRLLNFRIPTSRNLLHEDLDETILTDGSQVLHNIPVFQPLVQSYLLVEGLGIPERERERE